MIYTIYLAKNIINGKHYIGFDSKWPRRQYQHLKNSFNPNTIDYDCIFHRAIRKYGIESFVWEVLYQSTDKEHTIEKMEPYFIQENQSFSNGYNMTLGGEGFRGFTRVAWNKGIGHSEATKLKMRKPK